MPNLIPKGAPNGVLPRSQYQHLGHCESQALPSSQGFLTTAAGSLVKWAGFITHIWWETLKTCDCPVDFSHPLTVWWGGLNLGDASKLLPRHLQFGVILFSRKPPVL